MSQEATSFKLSNFQVLALEVIGSSFQKSKDMTVRSSHGINEIWFVVSFGTGGQKIYLNHDSFEVWSDTGEQVWEVYDFATEHDLVTKLREELSGVCRN